MKYLSIVCLLSLLVSCKNEPKMPSAEAETPSVQSLGVYGDTISTEGALSVSDAMEALKTNDSVMCAVSGYVTGVCQAKGCWMVLSSNPEDSTGFFVKFKEFYLITFKLFFSIISNRILNSHSNKLIFKHLIY